MIKKISDGEFSYKILLPNHDTDHLQKLIKNTSQPYELGMLKDMSSRINSHSVVLDIGANIGNHALYLAIVKGCKVICFEPDSNLTNSILGSAKVNKVLDKIEIHNTALGRENTTCFLQMSQENPESVGSQQVVAGSGEIIMTTLDSLMIDKVDCMKIDVEGFEENVLLGGINLIKDNLPIIYIEAWDKNNLSKIVDILQPLGYNVKQRFNATPTYLLTTD